MANKYTSRRSARRLAKKSKRNFIITLFLITLILYGTITWILPSFIGGLVFVKDFINPQEKVKDNIIENAFLAPPVLNIPYEATSTAQIDIKGYATPNSKVKLYMDDEEKQTVEVSEDGNFTFKGVVLNLGTNNIYAKSIDENNQESLTSKSIKVIYDDEEPTLNLNEPEDNKIIQGGDRKVKFSGNTEIEAQVFINDTRVIVDGNGNFVSEQSLNDGDNNFTIKALDKASNITEVTRKVIYQP